MGRFILTGSVRFLSRRQIQESLTGRTLILELLPLTIAEAHQMPQLDFFGMLSESKTFRHFGEQREGKSWCSTHQLQRYLVAGGLPGICLKKDSDLRSDMIEQQLETLLSRDLQMLYETKLSLVKLKLLLRELALIQGIEWSVEKTAKKIGISGPTLRTLLAAFEALFLIRRVNDQLYLEDGAISNFLVPNALLNPNQLMRAFVFRELFAQIRYRYSRSIEISTYATRGGIDIPFVFDFGERRFAITVESDSYASEKSIKGLGKFIKRHRNSTAVALHLGTKAYQSSTGIWCIPIQWIV